MRVGLNCVFLVPGETGGMEVYARELAARLGAHVDVCAFVSREGAALDWPVATVTVPVAATDRAAWVRGEQLHLPRLGRRARLDLLHSLASTAPAHGPFRRVATIHDLNYLHLPDAHFGLRALGMRVLVPLAARTSHRIIADSGSTRDDLVRLLGTPAGKVDVVALGFGQSAAAAPLAADAVRERFDLSARRPVLLTLSAKRPHKNLARLLHALARIEHDRPILVMPGYPTEHEAELRALARDLGLEADVRFVGWTAADELEGLFGVAGGFVFPSLHEGFGLPVLEAMARGVPVACSDRSSLPEVAGDAALLFDPTEPDAIAAAIVRLLGDGALRERLVAAGRERVGRFTWERCARETLAVYERTLGAAKRVS